MDREIIKAALRSGVEQQRLRALRELALARKQRAAKAKKQIQALYTAYRKGENLEAAEEVAAITKQLEKEAALDRHLILGRK